MTEEIVDVEPDLLTEEEEIIPPDPGETELSELLDSFGEGAISVKVSEETPSGLAYRYTALRKEDATEEALQRKFPRTGVYILRVMKDGQLRGVRRVVIGAPPGAEETNGNSSGAGAGDPYVRESIREMKDELRSLRNPAGQPGQLTEIAQVVKALQPAAAADPMAGAASMMTLMTGMLAFVKDAAGVKTDEPLPWYAEIFKAAAPALAPIVAPLVGGLMRNAGNGNGGVPGAVQPQIQANAEDPEAQVKELLRQGIAALKPKALSMSPDIVISYILSSAEMGDDRARAILQYSITHEFAEFAAIDPEIGQAPLVGFFHSIWHELHGQRFEDSESDSMDGDSGGEGGDGGNPPDDGKPDTAGGGEPRIPKPGRKPKP